MAFVLRMALREMRASWKRLIFFFLCLALGVAAVVALRSLIESVREALAREARTLTAADILIESNRPWSDDIQARIASRLRQAPLRRQMASIETTTMVRPEDTRRAVATMVELRGVEAGFPYYGRLELESGRPFEHQLLLDHGAVVRPEILTRLSVEVGERILIGDIPFTIRDVIVREPGRSLSMFTLGPRVIIDLEELEQTGLVQFGSRVRYQKLLQVEPASVAPLAAALEDELKGDFVRVRSFSDAEDRVGRRLRRTEDYLSLSGFVIMILGGIGVWSVVRVFVHQKLRSIAVLKCLGASGHRVLSIYVLQVLFLGMVGSGVGVLLAKVALSAVPMSLAGELETVSFRLALSAVAQGVGIGVLVSLLFSLVPLLDVRRVKPLRLLRPFSIEPPGRKAATGTRRGRWSAAWKAMDPERALAAALVSLALLAIATWQAGSLRIALYVCGGFAAVALVLYLAARLLTRAIVPLSQRGWFPLRHAVLSLSRPGNQTRVILLAVGLGSFFLLAVYTLQSGLLGQLDVELRDDAPDMFLIDVQQDQVAALAERARSLGASEVHMVPVLRARVTGVYGGDVWLDGYDQVREHGWLAREYVVTYRDHLDSNERLVAGRFWDATPAEAPEVSIEESLHERFRIRIGDRMRFDILGRTIDARVTSIRDVEWSDARNGGFMILFRPGVLEQAPHTYVGFVKGPPRSSERGRFQRDLVADFDNVSIIDLHQVLNDLRIVVDKITFAVTLIGGIAVVTGALILVGSLAMTKYQRRYETAILRTVGAKRRAISTMLLLEYGTLGTLAGVVGALGALAFTWLLSSRVLEIPWSPDLIRSLQAVALTGLGVALVGVAASVDVIRHKPIFILRAE